MRTLLKTFLLIYSFTSLILADTLTEETAIITEIIDGDTIDVRIEGEADTSRIRIVGIQTMEINLFGTSNDCFADEATQRVEVLTGGVGATVILRSKYPTQRDRFNRLLRHVFTSSGGQEIDLSKKLLEEGLALPLESYNENTYESAYLSIAQNAKKQEINIWSPSNHCSTVADSENVNLKILVHYDANGDDNNNLNDEWVKIRNNSGRSVDISHWWLRDSALNFFRFPASTIIADNGELIIHGGTGTTTNNVFYWGNNEPIFANSGDSAYLHDYLDYSEEDTETTYSPKGNIKSSFLYPCLGTCADNLKDKISIVAHYDAKGDDAQNINDEWIRITNISNIDINLQNYLLHYDLLGSKEYVFHALDILHPNEAMFIHVGVGTDSRLVKYIGRDTPILSNSSGKVWITTYDDIQIDEFAWPCTTGCTDPLSSKIQIRVNYDALGSDLANPNGEWVSIVNISNEDINLKDYLLNYDAKGSQSYFFNSNTILHENEALYLYMGVGTDSRLVKYVGRDSGILANSGGKAWLTRLDGLTVSEFSWPCVTNCHYDAPLEIINVNYDAQGNDATNPNGEWITIKNTSGTNINLRNWKLKVRDYHFNFTEDKILQPNNQIKVYMGSGNNGYYWGFDEGKLNNGGDVVKFLSPQRLLSHCYSWGSEANVCTNLLDSDNDGILNVNDSDDDGDNISDNHDDFPLSIHESVDTDNDGTGNNSDTDDDNDGISDQDEILAGSDPLDPNSKPKFFVPVVAYLLY